LKKLGLSILLSAVVFARFEAIPLRACEAYNNMKHTKNTHHVVLDTSKKYMVLKSHKGQKLVLIKGEEPAQRWVDSRCFSHRNLEYLLSAKSHIINIEDELSEIDKKKSISDNTKKYKQYYSKKYDTKGTSQKNLLALSWHNAFCETHRTKKECKRRLLSILKPKYYEKHFVLHGLWPQPKNRTYCNLERKYITMDRYKRWNKIPDIGLSSKTKERLSKVMPGFISNLHKHEWIKHGSCYGTDAEQYYQDAMDFTEQINSSKANNFFVKNIGKRVTLKQIRHQFDSSFGTGTGKRVELKCKNGLITELWLHLGSGSDIASMLQNANPVHSRCQKGLIDRAGFTKETTRRGSFGR